MDRQSKINEFVFALEGLSSSVIPKCFEISSIHLELLENEITSYINTNYPTIIFTKTELKDLIEKVYQKKHYHLKKSIDSNIGLMKYKLEDGDVDLEQIIDNVDRNERFGFDYTNSKEPHKGIVRKKVR